MQVKDPDTREAIAALFGFGVGAAQPLFALIIVMWGNNPRGDSFSLALTAVHGFTHPAAATSSPPGGAPPLSPSFNLTLYAKNTRVLGKSCFSHGQASLSYDGFAMGEATVPGWCARPKGTAEVEVVASGHGVQLPDRLRKRMEAELRWGATQLDVEAKLFRYPDDETAPVLLRCKAVGPHQLPAQPLPCHAYAAVELF
ncbi:unnamed protein product [Urochloa humidicola]